MTPKDEVRLVNFAKACGLIGPRPLIPLILAIRRATTTLYGEKGVGTGTVHFEDEKIEPLLLLKLKSYLENADTIGKLEMSILSSISFFLCMQFNKLLVINNYRGGLVPRHLANHCDFYEYFCDIIDDFLLKKLSTGFKRDVKLSSLHETLIKRKFGYTVQSNSQEFVRREYFGSSKFGILSRLLDLNNQKEIISSLYESNNFEDFILLWDFGDREYYKAAVGGMDYTFNEYNGLKSSLLKSLYGYDLNEIILCMYKNLSG